MFNQDVSNNYLKLFKKDEYNSLNIDDLECQDHKMPKKYWVPDVGKFYCEHDIMPSNDMIHFRYILDKYSGDIKNLKQMSSQSNGNSSDNLNNIYNFTNNYLERIFNNIFNFNESFKNFGNNFLKSFYELTDQDREIYRLKDLINSIKFDAQGKADYIGIGSDLERERNYLKLAKILISRNFTNSKSYSDRNLSTKLIVFMNEFQQFLISLAKDSNSLFDFSYQELMRELCKLDVKVYDLNYQYIKSPVIQRDELLKLTERIGYYESKISSLEISNENHSRTINSLNIEIQNLRKSETERLMNYNSKADEFLRLRIEYENKIKELEKFNQKYLIDINNLNADILRMKKDEENKIKDLEKLNQKFLIDINNLNAVILRMKKEEEERDICLSSQTDEFERMRNIYELKLKEFDQKIISLDNKYVSEKNSWEIHKNELLNTIEDNQKTISDLNKEIMIISEKLKYYANMVEAFTIEKTEWEVYISGSENYKYELQSQIKQNEILNIRIEELEKILNLSKEKSEQINLIMNRYNEHKLQFDDIFLQKELLEKDVIDKKNRISHLLLQIESINLKNDSVNTEFIALREQNRLVLSVQNSMKILTNQLEEANNLKSKCEMENAELNNRFSKLFVDLEQAQYKIEEYELQIQKQKEEINQLRNYEKKLNLLSNSKMEIDKLKIKLDQDRLSSSLVKSSSHKKFNSVNCIAIPNNFGNIVFNNISQEEINSKQKENYIPENNDFKTLIHSQTDRKFSKRLNFNNENNSEAQENLVCAENPNRNFASIPSNNLYEESSNKANFSQSFNVTPSGNVNWISQNILLSQKHWSMIKNWFGTLNINSKRVSFNLIMKATRDGFGASVFKKKCHKKPSTLVVVLTSHDKLIGGYTPLAWNSGDFVYVPDTSKKTFLFSLTNGKKYGLTNHNYAICYGTDIGPIFGGGSDLEIVSNCNKIYNNYSGIGHSFETDETEESFYGGKKYLVKDYEVYEVKY